MHHQVQLASRLPAASFILFLWQRRHANFLPDIKARVLLIVTDDIRFENEIKEAFYNKVFVFLNFCFVQFYLLDKTCFEKLAPFKKALTFTLNYKQTKRENT